MLRSVLAACLPIVDVPVHIVTGMPMTVGMGMRVAITMGTKTHNRHCPWLQSRARPIYFGRAHDMGTIAISGWMDGLDPT